ncbi:MAG: DnaD domain protein [Oscillospiraceae bacterium]|nr:DnaD domain protein [Oscillospiraceae bacterium]
MMFRLNLTLSGGFFAVPNEVADKHMLLATEKQLKTLMLMLRSPEQTITPEYIADKLKISSSDAHDHLMYWAEQGVISGCGEAAVPSSVQAKTPQEQPSVQPVSAPLNTHTAPTGQKISTNARVRLSAADINRMAESDSNIPLLLQETQLLLGRELTPSQTNLVMELYSEYNLSPRYIFTLINYCVSVGKGNMNYISSVAAGWMEKGIITTEQAEAEIVRLQQAKSRENQVKAILGIHDRNLTTNQKAHVARWFDEYFMTEELVRLAFDQTVDSIGKISFPYMDKIMLNWHQQGLKTPAEVEKSNQIRKNGNPTEQPSYDMDLIRKRFELGNIK